MKKILKLLLIAVILSCNLLTFNSLAQEDGANIELFNESEILEVKPNEYFKAKIVKIVEEGINEELGEDSKYQKVQLKILNGDEVGQQIIINHGVDSVIKDHQLVKINDQVILVKSYGFETNYFISEPYRIKSIVFLLIVFISIIFILIRWRGIMSLIGLAISILIIGKLIIPGILAGYNPLLISFIGALLISAITIYLAHGFKRKITISLISTIITIIIGLALALIFVKLTHLFGVGSEEAYTLQLGYSNINLKGLLLGGIIIGVLGILDDVTTTQAAAVEELQKANPNLNQKQLFIRAYEVGKEHMISMINTLALAYVGVSLPMFVLFYLNNTVPFWVNINNEFIAEEVVRTLVGSLSLVLAIPISTYLASRYLKSK